jgi:hypothetical protein
MKRTSVVTKKLCGEDEKRSHIQAFGIDLAESRGGKKVEKKR